MQTSRVRITETLDVAAPAATVWRVVTDLDRYPEWNPFVVACRSTLEPGAPIDMRVRAPTRVQHRPRAPSCPAPSPRLAQKWNVLLYAVSHAGLTASIALFG